MSDFVCGNCNKGFSRKRNLDYHVKKNACKQNTFFCKHCNSGFTTKSSMYRHVQKHCREKKKNEKDKEGIYERLLKLEKEKEEQHKEIIKLKNELKQVSIRKNTINKSNINNGVINNNSNNITNNFTLIAYGREDFSKLDRSEILQVLRNGFNSSTKLTEVLHFNPKYPEYQNVYISNIKDKYAMMYDGNNWNLTTKEELIEKIYDDKKNYIEDNLEEFIDSLSDSRKNALKRWLDTNDKDKKITRIKDNIKLLLYNKRNIVLNTHTITDKNKPDRSKSKSNKEVKDAIIKRRD